ETVGVGQAGAAEEVAVDARIDVDRDLALGVVGLRGLGGRRLFGLSGVDVGREEDVERRVGRGVFFAGASFVAAGAGEGEGANDERDQGSGHGLLLGAGATTRSAAEGTQVAFPWQRRDGRQWVRAEGSGEPSIRLRAVR